MQRAIKAIVHTKISQDAVYKIRLITGYLHSPKTSSDKMQFVLQVEKIKIDEMRLPEKLTYTLPPCNASTMKVVTKLLSESVVGETLLETQQLNVPLIVSNILYVIVLHTISKIRRTLLLFAVIVLFVHANA